MPGPMPDIAFTLPGPETVTLSGLSVDMLINAGDGDAALLYLYILKSRGRGTLSEAASALNKDAMSIANAMAVLSRLGLIQYGELPAPLKETTLANPLQQAYYTEPQETFSAKPLQEAYPSKPLQETYPAEPKQYTAAELTSELQSGSDFSILVEEIQRSLGKLLSPDELERLLGIYDGLQLPSDVILQLVTHCITESRGRGGGRMPSMRYIEKAAYTWEREGIFSLDKAEEYLKALYAHKSARGEIKKALQINDREFSASEKRYVDNWIALGVDPDAVGIAYDRTVLKTGKLAWGYINSIINNWHEKNIHTGQDVLDKDAKPAPNSPPKNANASTQKFGAPDTEDIKRMERLLKKIKEQ